MLMAFLRGAAFAAIGIALLGAIFLLIAAFAWLWMAGGVGVAIAVTIVGILLLGGVIGVLEDWGE